MRSPRSVCSNGSSHTAHSLPTNVRSRRVRLLSAELAITLLSMLPTLRELLLTTDLMEPTDELERLTEVPRVPAVRERPAGRERDVSTPGTILPSRGTSDRRASKEKGR